MADIDILGDDLIDLTSSPPDLAKQGRSVQSDVKEEMSDAKPRRKRLQLVGTLSKINAQKIDFRCKKNVQVNILICKQRHAK